MKIQNINKYIGYKSNSKPIKNEESAKTKKYDVIDLKSKTKHDTDNFNLNSIKKNIVSQVDVKTNADKINRIKDSINNNTYKIDAEEIVKRLLK